jgi:hypothetical protein
LLQTFKLGCALCKNSAGEFENIDFTTLTSKHVVVVDTATQLGMSVLAHLTKNKPVDFKPERDDWGALRKYTEFFSSQFQGFTVTYPCSLIVICHCMEAALEDGRSKLVPNFGSAGMSAAFAKSFSHVIYTDVVNKVHKAYSSTGFSNNVLTKSRTDFEIEKLAVPSLAPLFEGIQAPVAPAITNTIDDLSHPQPQSTAQLTPAQNALNNLRKIHGGK